MTDVILFGEPMALFTAQEEGALKDVMTFKRMLAGAEVNVAIGMTRLGFNVNYITKLGLDPFGIYIKEKLEEEGVKTTIFYDSSHSTGLEWKNRVSKGDPDTYYLRKNSACSYFSKEEVDQIDFTGAKLLHITGIFPALSKKTREATYRMIEKAREHHMLISFDPNVRKSLWQSKEDMIETINDIASKVDIVLPGTAEGELLMGSKDEKQIAHYYREHGAKTVVVKLGSEGAYGEREQIDGFLERGYFKGYPVEKVVDTVGAGDGFAVGILSAYLEGKTLEEIGDRGNIIGAMQVMVESDNEDLPTLEDIREFRKKNSR